MSLVALADLKNYLGETTTNYDIFLQSQIDLFSSTIENYCNRKFLSNTYTQTFYYDDYRNEESKDLWLFHYPNTAINSIKEITTYNGVDSETLLTASQYRINKKNGYVRRLENDVPTSWFNVSSFFSVSGFNSRIEVEYVSGYVSTPLEIVDVMYNLIEERYLKKKAGVQVNFGNDVQRISVPGVMSIDFDYSLQANERKSKFGMILGNYGNVLDFYRSERAIVGEIKETYIV